MISIPNALPSSSINNLLNVEAILHSDGKHITVGLPTFNPAGPSFALPLGALTLGAPAIPPPTVAKLFISTHDN